jgi:DNA-binding transcriptional MerR regulator
MISELQLFEPQPGRLYTLEMTAELAGVTRREVLVYCRAGLVRPVFQQPFGMLAFDDVAIHAIRRAVDLQMAFDVNLAGAKAISELMEELQRLRVELEFWRRR